jgi:type II secretory pathway pseudopilin PulG
MLEMVVSMLILSVVMAGFMSAVIVMSRTTTTTRQVIDGSSQLRVVLDSLGRNLTAAVAVNAPTPVGQDLYVEFEVDAKQAGVPPLCTQWRYQPASGLIQQRTWDTVNPSASAWTTRAANVVNDVTTQPPFTVLAADSTHAAPRVLVDLRIHPAGGPLSADGSAFVLRNYVSGGPSPVCTQVGRS